MTRAEGSLNHHALSNFYCVTRFSASELGKIVSTQADRKCHGVLSVPLSDEPHPKDNRHGVVTLSVSRLLNSLNHFLRARRMNCGINMDTRQMPVN